MIGAIVDTTTLGKAVAYSLAAGIGIAAIFGAGVTSAAALLEARRDGRTLAELAWGALALVCLLGAGAAIVLGSVVMTQKG
jgi:CHASE2 domain-containing sensor protein